MTKRRHESESSGLGSTIVMALLLVIVIVSMPGCGDTSFKGGADKRGGLDATPNGERNFSLSCDESSGVATLETELKSSAAANIKSVRMTGEFCKLPEGVTPSSGLDILFVIDTSFSMERSDPLEKEGTVESCGRLRAAQAIISKMESAASPNLGKVRFGLVSFASAAITKAAPGDLATFRSSLTPEAFCEITRGPTGATNYEAAFAETSRVLESSRAARSVVYFISDGMPTRGGGLVGSIDAPYVAGRSAAEALRSGASGVVLNAVYLGSDASSDPPAFPGQPSAEDYLTQITGSRDLVRIVNNAEQLAAEITKFETPEAGNLDASSARGSISAQGLGERPIRVESVVPDAARKGVYTFRTEAFALLGNGSPKAGEQTVLLTIKASDGSERAAKLILKIRD